jgi:hypothetical protein
MNLFEQIQQGESKTLELKSQLPLHDQIAKTVVYSGPHIPDNSLRW